MPGSYSTPPDLLPLPDDDGGRGDSTHGSLGFWRKQIQASYDKVQVLKPEWDRNVQSYRGKPLVSVPTTDTVVVPRDFPFVEQKLSQLFFQTPEVHLTPKQDGLKDAVTVFQAVVNHYLSEDEVDALAVMNEVGFDALCPAGLMVSKIGYENFQGPLQQVATGQMVPDPSALDPAAGGPQLGTPLSGQLPGAVLGLGAPAPTPPQIPEMTGLPQIVHQRYFWERISPAAVLIPVTFTGSKYDKAPWLGFKFEEDWAVIKKRYKLPDDATIPRKRGEDQDLKLSSERRDEALANTQKVVGAEIWYRTAYFDPVEPHPEKMRQLILLDGYDSPLVHRDSPYQQAGPSGDVLGMLGFPVHIGALRYVSDTAYPPSECSIAQATNQELNRSRTQMMLQRDRSIPMRFADLARVGGEGGLEKLRANVYQSIIPLASWDANNPPVGIVQLASFPRENFTFNDYLDMDLGQVWAMGQNQRGQEAEGEMTATEVATIDEWATTRLDKERRMMLKYFIGGVRKLAALIQQFSDEMQTVKIVGPDKQPAMQAWNKDLIAGQYAFSARPDSSIRIDQAQAQTKILKLYELLGKDPNVKRTELLDELCRQWNLEPSKIIVPEVPEPGPEPPKITLAIKSEDLMIGNPSFPIYYALLKESGIKSLDQPDPQLGGMTPVQLAMQWAAFQQQTMNAALGGSPAGAPPQMGAGAAPQPGVPSNGQPPHPGSMPKVDHINKHQADETGQLPGPGPVM